MKTAFVAAAIALASTAAMAQTTIRVDYANPNIWTETQEILAEEFMKSHPDVTIKLDGPADTYAEGVQRLLRQNVANDTPDVAYVGLNRLRILEDRGMTQPLDAFIGDNPEEQGYTPALLSLGTYKGKQHGLATSASTLVMYVNPELVKKAGGSMDNFPTDFDGIIDLAAKINALDSTIDGIWIEPHDWRYQSLLGAHGGRPLNADESDVTFDSEAGIAAAGLYQRFTKEAGMKPYGANDARQAFPAGTLGIMLESSSLQARFETAAGDRFKVVVKGVPLVAKDQASIYFPTGGSGIVMLSKDEAKQKAAWEYIAFVTGPVGQKIIVENTGYAPANAILVRDDAYLGEFYKKNPNSLVAHTQIANHAGPWYAYPGPNGVAVTDEIAAALVEVREGADPAKTMKETAENVRAELGMK